MIAHKNIGRIVLIAVAAAVLFCIIAIIAAPKLIEKYGTGVRMEYESRIFDHSTPVVIDIQMDPDEWEEMLDTATQEVYHSCDVVINGTRFSNVGIRPKGNTSLSSIASNPNTDRFSFKVEFDQYIDGQTAWGLDKLCLNNNYADATNMKEALVYDMYAFLGADASLYNYAEIYVNGEYWGVYLALEAVEDSFMLRNYGVQEGELYKPDSMGMSWGGDRGSSGDDNGWGWLLDLFGVSDDDEASGEMRWGRDEDDENSDASGEMESGESESRESRRSRWRSENSDASAEPEPTVSPDPMPPSGNLSESMQAVVDEIEANSDASGEASGESERSWGWGDREDDGGGFGGGMFGNGGGNLNYTGDDLDNYSTIWGSEVTKTTEEDHRRVVEALKNISEGENLEEYMDIDNLLRLMAVHNFSVNNDSLSGSMAHNYYLYESGGQLNILPWDYNLAFSGMGFGSSDADGAANEPIDDSWGSTNFFDPLLENEEYRERYHEYYRQLIEEYVFGGGFYEFYTRTREQIDDLVATDPNALYDYDEYDAAAETLYALVLYRAQSIQGQLDGTIPSTSAGQREDSSNLVHAEGVDLSLMGSMSMGGSFGGGGGWGEDGDPFRRMWESSGESSDESGSGEASDEDASGEASNENASEESAGDASDEPVSNASDEPVSNASDEPVGNASDEPEEDASVEPAEDASDEPEENASDEPEDDASNEPEGDASGEAESGNSWRDRMAASEEMERQENAKIGWLLAACLVVLFAGVFFAAKFRKKG